MNINFNIVLVAALLIASTIANGNETRGLPENMDHLKAESSHNANSYLPVSSDSYSHVYGHLAAPIGGQPTSYYGDAQPNGSPNSIAYSNPHSQQYGHQQFNSFESDSLSPSYNPEEPTNNHDYSQPQHYQQPENHAYGYGHYEPQSQGPVSNYGQPETPQYQQPEQSGSDYGQSAQPLYEGYPQAPQFPSSNSKPCYSTHTSLTIPSSRGEIFIHRPAPIIVNRPPTQLTVNHPPLIVKPAPVVLHKPPPAIVNKVTVKNNPRKVKYEPIYVNVVKPPAHYATEKPCAENAPQSEEPSADYGSPGNNHAHSYSSGTQQGFQQSHQTVNY